MQTLCHTEATEAGGSILFSCLQTFIPFIFTYLIVVYLFTTGGGDAGKWRYIRERENAVANGSKWRVSTITFYSK